MQVSLYAVTRCELEEGRIFTENGVEKETTRAVKRNEKLPLTPDHYPCSIFSLHSSKSNYNTVSWSLERNRFPPFSPIPFPSLFSPLSAFPASFSSLFVLALLLLFVFFQSPLSVSFFSFYFSSCLHLGLSQVSTRVDGEQTHAVTHLVLAVKYLLIIVVI